MPLFQTLKGCIEKSNFHWTPVAKATLQHLKEDMHKLPTLACPIRGKTLQVYLVASNKAISSVLVLEREGRQLSVYFVSRALQGPKINYPVLEKLVLALVYAARCLRRYFQEHQVEVLTSYLIKQVLLKPEMIGHLAKWAIKLGEHNISYHPCTSIKCQALPNFLLEISDETKPIA